MRAFSLPRLLPSPPAALALFTLLLPVSALAAKPAAAPAPAQVSRGERALKGSFYRATVPTLVELVTDVKPDVLEALEVDPKVRGVVDKALSDLWTEKRLYANSAAALEKELSPQILDAAIAKMTPEIQDLLRAATTEAVSAEQAQEWLAVAKKHPDAKAREALGRRIAAHMPAPGIFTELVVQVVEVLADAAQVATGTDELRAELRESLLEGLAPAIQAMGQKDLMATAAVIAYREQPTAKLTLLADALDSDAGKKLQSAAAASLVAGAKQTRQELVARLKRELAATKKK